MSAIWWMGIYFAVMRYSLRAVVRVFTGNFAQMFESMQRFNQLPNETVVCPAHEYTRGNLAFAETVLADKKCGQKSTCFSGTLSSRG